MRRVPTRLTATVCLLRPGMRRRGGLRVTSGEPRTLANESENCVAIGSGHGDKARQFDGRTKQRVDLHWAAALQILQHRGLMRADLAAAVDAPLDIEEEAPAGYAESARFRNPQYAAPSRC